MAHPRRDRSLRPDGGGIPDPVLGFMLLGLILLGLSFGISSAPNPNAVMSSVEKRFLDMASGTLGTMRLTGQMLSRGIATLLFALYLGREQIVPQNYPRFLAGMHTAFGICAALCCIGAFAKLARGKMRGKG